MFNVKNTALVNNNGAVKDNTQMNENDARLRLTTEDMFSSPTIMVVLLAPLLLLPFPAVIFLFLWLLLPTMLSPRMVYKKEKEYVRLSFSDHDERKDSQAKEDMTTERNSLKPFGP